MKLLKTPKNIRSEILRNMLFLASFMTILIAIVSIIVNLRLERQSLDCNLQNIARAVAQSDAVRNGLNGDAYYASVMRSYLDSLEDSISNTDVISVIDADRIRRYHTTAELIGTEYDGTLPDFSRSDVYVSSDTGPSGAQRRAYAAIRGADGEYIGFILAVMLDSNYHRIIRNIVIIHSITTAAVIALALALSRHLADKIKKRLGGHEPDTFSAMFGIRDNVLDAINEGIIAADTSGKILYRNRSAQRMAGASEKHSLRDILPKSAADRAVGGGEEITGILLHPSEGTDILADLLPVTSDGSVTGTLCILHDRTEYTRIMEDLSGVRYLVESMRANNHDFTNKLHVILGLIQMGETEKASEFIANVTAVQQNMLHNIMTRIEDPSVSALLIGKYIRASELNIKFTLDSGSRLSRSDIALPSGDLVTIIGNLIENAADSINEKPEPPKDLTVGIFTCPHAMIIQVDDTGTGIDPECTERIFENGFSTKGENRGTGLYVVNRLAEKYNGAITVESEPGIGTAFTVTLADIGGSMDV